MIYTKPECEILEFEKDDILTASTPLMPVATNRADDYGDGDGLWY